MLSRHFYRVDELRAALLYCIARRRTSEALFWAQEYLDSELYDEFFQVLFEGWLWFTGIGRVEWLRQFWTVFHADEVDADEIYKMLELLLRIPVRDCSLEALLLLAPDVSVCERLPPTPKTDKWLSDKGFSDQEAHLLRYFHTGKAVSAWRLLCVQNESAFWPFVQKAGFPQDLDEIFQHFRQLYYEDDKDMNLALRAFAVAYLSLTEKQRKASCSPLIRPTKDYYEEDRKRWISLTGRRKRREIAIPKECLSWITSRGVHTYKKHTLRELWAVGIHTLKEKGCPYWQRRLEEDNPFASDDALEAFYDLEFPDDIPDEWSREDQNKSHGDGPLNVNEERNPGKLLRKWYWGISSCLVWAAVDQISKSSDCWKDLSSWSTGYASRYEGLTPPVVPKQALQKSIQLISYA
jgi:hypothetical protein